MNVSRRSVIAGLAVGVSGLSGCIGRSDVPDVTVWNESEGEVEVTIRIVNMGSDTVVFHGESAIHSGDAVRASDPIQSPGEYVFEVSVDEQFEESYEWRVKGSEAAGIEIVVRDDGLSFSEVKGSWL